MARGPAPFWLRLRSVLGGVDRRIRKPLKRNLACLKTAAEAAPDARQEPARRGAAAAS